MGNLTVGGTGKTPVVELLAKTLRERGRRVAILSRGYKSRKLKEPQNWKGQDGSKIPPEKMPKLVSTGRALLLDSEVCRRRALHARQEPRWGGRGASTRTA